MIYFIACFEHQCNTMRAFLIFKSSLMYGGSLDMSRFMNNFRFNTICNSTVLRKNKNYRDTIVPVGSSASLL